MRIDCNDCAMNHTDACRDCVVTHVLCELGGPLEVDEERAEALEILADAGLVPELRLLRRTAGD